MFLAKHLSMSVISYIQQYRTVSYHIIIEVYVNNIYFKNLSRMHKLMIYIENHIT